MKFEKFDTSLVENYLILEEKRDGVHWGWVIFWALLCWPVLLLTALIHFNSAKVYYTALKFSDGRTERLWLNQEAINEFKMKEW